MKLAIVGGRDFEHYGRLCAVVCQYFHCGELTIISGGARGADALAKDFARDHKLSYVEYPADWNKHGKAAGFIRNQHIVDACDVVLAFWDGKSRGTKDTLNKAAKAKKSTFIIYY